jgi:hypothetical protein
MLTHESESEKVFLEIRLFLQRQKTALDFLSRESPMCERNIRATDLFCNDILLVF